MTESTVQGFTAPGFEEVELEFVKNFDARGEVGASLAIYVEGQLVVDLWGGIAQVEKGTPWERDTVGLVYSATKGATSILVNRLIENGVLELDKPVASYWPEFAAAGKGDVTVAQLLSHQAGLPALSASIPLDLAQLLAGTAVVEALAAQASEWPLGEGHGYHALTFGWLVGELVKRATGRSLGAVFADEVANPLGLDFWIGLPADRASGVAHLVDGIRNPAELQMIPDLAVRAKVEQIFGQMGDPASLFARTLSTNGVLPTPSAAAWNNPAVYAAEQPAANGISNGRSIARMYAACVGEVDGIRLLSEETVDRARAEQVRGADRVTIGESRFGVGFQLPIPTAPLMSESSFGHVGAGGALGFADVDARVGFGYVQNKLNASMLGDPRTPALVGALRRALS